MAAKQTDKDFNLASTDDEDTSITSTTIDLNDDGNDKELEEEAPQSESEFQLASQLERMDWDFDFDSADLGSPDSVDGFVADPFEGVDLQFLDAPGPDPEGVRAFGDGCDSDDDDHDGQSEGGGSNIPDPDIPQPFQRADRHGRGYAPYGENVFAGEIAASDSSLDGSLPMDQLAEIVRRKLPSLPPKEMKGIIMVVKDAMIESLAAQGQLNIPGFAKFVIKNSYPARPRALAARPDGKVIKSGARRPEMEVTMIPGTALKKAVARFPRHDGRRF